MSRGPFAPLVLAAFLVWLAGGLSLALAADDPASWPIAVPPTELPAPGLGFLNHRPAGIHGRVVAAGPDLAFEDGTPVRFWGTNLQAYALFATEPANIPVQARRLAALGFNLVRIHHHDSSWVQPNVFGRKADTTRRLDPDALHRLDLWIDALKAEGIYVWLDLHVGRQITAADGVAAFGEIAKGRPAADLRGFNYVSPDIQTLMLDFQRAYLGHVNPLTGLSWAEDPAVAAVLITNENDLTHHFGNALLPDKDVPEHNTTYMALAEEFAAAHGLSRRATWRSWEFGPSKIFLNDLERRFNERMIAGVRDTGFRGLIATTNTWGRMSIAGLPSLTMGSIVDAHSYGVDGEVGHDPREKPGFLDWIAAAQVAGMPLTISEWNIGEFPVADRFVAPLRMAASAAHQGWDAPVIYGYAQGGLNGPLPPSNWDIAYDPAMIAMMPAAALLYRQGHVRPAARTYALTLDDDTFYGQPVTPETSAAIRTAFEQSRLVVRLPPTPELPWLTPADPPADAIPITDPDRSLLPADATEVVADTGDFRRDFTRGIFTVETPESQIAAGRLGGETITLPDVQVALETPLAAVAVQSLDGLPISRSARIMISLTARAVPSSGNGAASHAEPLRGTLRIRARPGLSLKRAGTVPVTEAHRIDDDEHVIDLGALEGANWLILE